MRPCQAVKIVTPKKFVLNGLWFGSRKPKQAIVWVHGLGSSMFSKLDIANRLIDKKTAVLVFNNRGHDKVAHVPHASGKFSKALHGGAAHERFTDSIDDVQGAVNFVRKMGVKSLYLAGHSTGCQKSAYWASKRSRGVKGIILLAPMSDYSAIRTEYNHKKVEHALSVARAYVRSGRGKELLPAKVCGWPWIADAQRFLSLYSGKGAEEIFTFWEPSRKPRTLESIHIPVLVFLAQREEFSALSAPKIAMWFDEHVKALHRIVIVPKVGHSFKGGEKRVAFAIRNWMNVL